MAETMEYTGPNGVTRLVEVIEERATGTTILNLSTGERHPGVRLLLAPLDGSPRFWSVAMRRVSPTPAHDPEAPNG